MNDLNLATATFLIIFFDGIQRFVTECVYYAYGILNSKSKPVTKFRLSGGGQKALDQGMENLLFEWIKMRRLHGFRISRSIIQKKAKELSKIEDFKASDGWCTNFMHRFGIAYRTKTQQLEVC